MEDIDSSPLYTNPKKRAAPDEDSPAKKPLNLKGTQFMMPTPPDTDQSSNASPTCNYDGSAREVSPAPSSTTLSSADIVSSPATQGPAASTIDLTSDSPVTSGTAPPPKKRRKLTPAEKEEQRKEKEAKAAEKAAEKARKDAEKAAEKVRKEAEKARKDEEKRVKDEAKRKKAEEVEAEKRAKELKKEEEAQKKVKKEQNQMRLGAFNFFEKRATPVREPGLHDSNEGPSSTARGRSLSLEPYDAVADLIRRSESPSKKAAHTSTAQNSPVKPALSDYRKYFLPYELKPNTTMPRPRMPADPEAEQDAFDHAINDPSLQEKYDLGLVESYAGLEHHFAFQRPLSRGLYLPNMRRLWAQIHGSVEEPIDLTSEKSPINPLDVLQAVSRRHIEFSEDVRPAYYGTYTKIRSPGAAKRLSRNPWSRERPDTDYDYDSEVEWEADEGEDLMDEEDDEAESQADAGEMDGFVEDDEEASKNKRKLITGDLIPSSTGLCWEDESGRIVSSIEGGVSAKALNDMRIGVLIPGFTGQTIDPFSTAYWESDQAPAPIAPVVKVEQTAAVADASMPPPPRAPLQTRPSNNATLDHMLIGGADGDGGSTGTTAAAQGPKTARKSTPKALSKEDMDEFKGFVIGSTANKADLLKELKTRFPKLTNDTIKTTLGDNFAQVGASKAEKKWGFVSIA